MRENKMTAWDAGQDLIACADTLGDKEESLREGGFTELADVLKKARLEIGDVFNRHGSHGFGLPGAKS